MSKVASSEKHCRSKFFFQASQLMDLQDIPKRNMENFFPVKANILEIRRGFNQGQVSLTQLHAWNATKCREVPQNDFWALKSPTCVLQEESFLFGHQSRTFWLCLCLRVIVNRSFIREKNITAVCMVHLETHLCHNVGSKPIPVFLRRQKGCLC